MNPEPGKILATKPSVLAFWDDSDSAWKKRGHFMRVAFDTPVSPWFGEPLRMLARRLWRWFRRRVQYGDNTPTYPQSLNPDQDYDAILAEVRQCLAEMGLE